MQLVECVPNFSEGRNERTINAIAEAIRQVEGVSLLDVDPGKSTNRTVFTFVGEPERVLEAAFQSIAVAQNLIDMRVQHGEHPRMGATDVCPFVPVGGVTMAECAELARRLGKRVGEELGIPVYLYAEAAARESRRNLADIRAGEYEALAEKMKSVDFAPDFGPMEFNAKSGATVIGARPFLIAYNVNLNTRSKKIANDIAFSIREAGKAMRNEKGENVRDDQGNSVKVAGTLKACRAVGWVVDEYERAQVSINLVDPETTSLHHAFDEVERQGQLRGVRATGSEIVGLVPLSAMLDAGRYYLEKQGRSLGVSEKELITVAVQTLGLAELTPFDPAKKIIEYSVQRSGKLLKDMKLTDFMDELASESVAPGGGSVAALCGSLSAALTAMVANLTHDKKGFESKRVAMSGLAFQSQKLKQFFLNAVDADMQAFNAIVEARRLPKDTQAKKDARNQAIDSANRLAIEVPLKVLESSVAALDLASTAAQEGNPNSLSDAGVAGLTALACAEGAYFNVLINLSGLDAEANAQMKEFASQSKSRGDSAIAAAREKAEGLRSEVLARLGT